MSQDPNSYGKTVAATLRRATALERAEIQAELDAHVSDHTEALVEAGYPLDRAQRLAEEAMGDPQEVAYALDKEFSRGWLVVSRLALVALILLLLWQVPYLLSSAENLFVTSKAQTDPIHSPHHERTYASEPLYPLDVSFSFPNGDVATFYALNLIPDSGGDTYTVHLYLVCYNKNPLRTPYYNSFYLFTFRSSLGEIRPISGGSGVSSATYSRIKLPPLELGDTLTVGVALLDAEAEIPLPWEEVTAP